MKYLTFFIIGTLLIIGNESKAQIVFKCDEMQGRELITCLQNTRVRLQSKLEDMNTFADSLEKEIIQKRNTLSKLKNQLATTQECKTVLGTANLKCRDYPSLADKEEYDAVVAHYEQEIQKLDSELAKYESVTSEEGMINQEVLTNMIDRELASIKDRLNNLSATTSSEPKRYNVNSNQPRSIPINRSSTANAEKEEKDEPYETCLNNVCNMANSNYKRVAMHFFRPNNTSKDVCGPTQYCYTGKQYPINNNNSYHGYDRCDEKKNRYPIPIDDELKEICNNGELVIQNYNEYAKMYQKQNSSSKAIKSYRKSGASN